MNKKIVTQVLCLILAVTFSPVSKNVLASQNKEHISWEDSMARNVEPFNKYDVYYNKEENAIYYNEQRVKAFVDLKSKGWFNIGFYDSKADSDLFLKSIRSVSGDIIGIEKMPLSMIEELYGNRVIKEALPSNDKKSEKDRVYSFDATTILEDSSIIVTDKLRDLNIPNSIEKWISNYSYTEKAGLKSFKKDGMIDAWFCYGGENRLTWNVKADGDTLKLYLFECDFDSTQDSTVIHYTAPEKYKNLEVYLNNNSLDVSIDN